MYLGGIAPLECSKKPRFSLFLLNIRTESGESKYLSKWCSNPLALTIYVNAKVLLFSPMNSQPLAPCPAKV